MPDLELVDCRISCSDIYVSEQEYGEEMGNTANKQCPMCRSTDVDQKYVTTELYYQCNACGERFK
jgi:uncharacterized protein (DUF983 family)